MEHYYGLIELFAVFGVVLALLGFDLFSLRLSLRGTDSAAEQKSPTGSSQANKS